VSFAATGLVHGVVPSLVALSLAMLGLASMLGPFWAFATSFLAGVGAAAGIALVNSVGNVAGFASTYVVGWLADLTHSNVASLYLFGGLVLLGAVLVLLIPPSVVNK
jgi:hypothetical protein